MRTFALILSLFAFTGCASDHVMHVSQSDFQSKWIDRELRYYSSQFSSHPTNHFYVGALELDDGQLITAWVYWKEERTLLEYIELADDARDGVEILAWRHQLKLDRDTVDTEDDIGGSTYLVTHHQWVEWMDDCVTRGRPYCITMAEARRMYPLKEGDER
jgi:hypothetical protein